MGPVVVGVDGSAPSQLALEWAVRAAKAHDAPLTIVHAPRFSGPEVAAEALSDEVRQAGQLILDEAERAARSLEPDLTVSAEFAHDGPAGALIAYSKQASQVVVGNRGHGGFHDLLLGSTSLQTAMHAHCTVAVIRPRSGGLSNRRIVVGVDGSEHGKPALAYAFAEAQRSGCALTAVHAWEPALPAVSMGIGIMPPPVDMEAVRAVETSLLERELEDPRRQYPGVPVHTVIAEASPSAALTEHSKGAEAVVIGSRGLGGFSGMLLGSVGHALIHHAGCPVIIAR